MKFEGMSCDPGEELRRLRKVVPQLEELALRYEQAL